MISVKISQALNLQMNREFYNSRLYLSMATYLHSINLAGAAHWMEVQAQEETGHAMRLYKHLLERGARIIVEAIAAPPQKWDSPLAAFQDAYRHVCKVTKEFDELVALARAENDNATEFFLQWFVTEQVEEEDSTDSVVQKFLLTEKANGEALFMIDRMLAERGK